MNRSHIAFFGLAIGCATGACGGRPSYWNTPVFAQGTAFGLTNGVAVVDDADHRVVVLTAGAGQTLSTNALPIGHGFTSAATSPDGSTLFVLSSGDWPRQSVSDEAPSLTVVSDKSFQPTAVRYTMSQPLASLAIDPLGRYVVAYAGSGSTASFTQNPNEVVIFDLFQPPSTSGQPANPVSRTIRSYGGTPQRLTFTPTLNRPVNAPSTSARRLLIIETQIDLTFVDLDHAFDLPTPRPDITVRLTSGTSAQSVAPAAVVVDGNADDGRIALRTQNDHNVYTIQLLASQGGAPSASTPNPNDFNPAINLTDVGGTPSDIAFVRTDQGLRVAALVPSRSEAVLVEPDTSATTHVALGAPYSSLSLVTNVLKTPTDVALLWSGGSGIASGVALWALGVTVGQPYRSIEVLDIADPIQAVVDVPGSDGSSPSSPPRWGNPQLKVLETNSGGDFFVLDLLQRTAAPLHTTSVASLSIAPDGARMWTFAVGGTDLASIDFATLNPVPLTTNFPISSAFDVKNSSGGRSLIAVHAQGTLGATVFDALKPDTATSRQTPAILLEGP